jgi:hypothetical protein
MSSTLKKSIHVISQIDEELRKSITSPRPFAPKETLVKSPVRNISILSFYF